MSWTRKRAQRNRSYLTGYAISQILELGRYIGRKPINRTRRMRDSMGNWEEVDWLRDMIRRGVVDESDVSIDWAHPDRPIQVIFTEGTYVSDEMVEQARQSSSRRTNRDKIPPPADVQAAPSKDVKQRLQSIIFGK